MKKVRVQTLLDPETVARLEKEAKEKQITVSAVIRQRVETSLYFDKEMEKSRCAIQGVETWATTPR